MRFSSGIFIALLGLVSACGGSSAPSDAAPAGPSPASTPAPAPSASVAAPAVTTAAAVVDPNVCRLGKMETWKECVGKQVEVLGQTPKMVYQHPMIAPVGMPGSAAPTMKQGYLELSEGNQIIVISKDADSCSGAKRVKGSLRQIDLGGPAGTKESYRGWAIENATITCE